MTPRIQPPITWHTCSSTSASERPLVAGTWKEWSASETSDSAACGTPVRHIMEQTEIGERVLCALKQQHGDVPRVEVLGPLRRGLAGGVQPIAKEYQAEDTGQW